MTRSKDSREILDVRLEPFDSALHEELLLAWLRRPHVIEWWGDPEKAEEGLHLLTRPIDTHALIAVNGVAVGYLCWEKLPSDLEAAGLTDLPEELIDVDILIGEPEMIGRGVGSRALTLLIYRLRHDPAISFLGLGPSVLNASAIRAYEKVGFRRVREFEDPDCGPSQYMILKIRNSGGIN